ncbi:transcription termination factor Rho [Acetobacterium fimetarium]|uniref:Transcription termination factor Rho n=1 Tax=Acetobacterium fimetarium TaxID=52691 RepID=A0ABR6WZB2_9FIRM|nr:transcription termination factor Rho [Acetobacterium fimetarium]MBC3805514.1 transcription termination factor Rho [Acetobacterium fimetarium]
MERKSLEDSTVVELRKQAERLGIEKTSRLKKIELIDAIEALEEQTHINQETKQDDQGKDPSSEEKNTKTNQSMHRSANGFGNNGSNGNGSRSPYYKIKDSMDNVVVVEGILEILPEGFGFVKNADMSTNEDFVYISGSQIQKFKLKNGDVLSGKVRPPKSGEKYSAMLFLEKVNGTKTADIIQKINSMLYVDDKKDLDRFKSSQEGILDVNPDGFGFLRTNHYLSGDNDIYVAANQIRRFNLRTGDKIVGKIKMTGENEKFDALLYVEKVNGDIPEKIANRPRFEQLTPIFPEDRITLETTQDVISTRIIDLFSPMGKGQRGMIVAPPKAGKTILLKEIATGITTNHPDVELIILLVDERPEEVTDMKRSVDADIVYSTFDQPAENHIKVAEIVLERGKRLVEQGKDVVILVDSLTRLTRGNNLVVSPSGRTLSGGLDPEALFFPKKFFGSARNVEEGGSLTILATTLVDTGSRMDDIIFEEFKGTGNMELHLERELAERRIFPAINLNRSGTRREEKLLSDEELKVSFHIRKLYKGTTAFDLTDKIISILEKTKDNKAFIKKYIDKFNA